MFMTFVKNALGFSLWMIQTSITVLQPIVMGEFRKLDVCFFLCLFLHVPHFMLGQWLCYAGYVLLQCETNFTFSNI